MITIYTDAPKAYDYDYCVRNDEAIGIIELNKTPIYEVQIPESKLENQCNRYGSGLHVSLDKRQLIEWIEDGLARTYKWIS